MLQTSLKTSHFHSPQFENWYSQPPVQDLVFTAPSSRFSFHSPQFRIRFSQSSVQDLVFTASDFILGVLGHRDCVGDNKMSLLLCTSGTCSKGVD